MNDNVGEEPIKGQDTGTGVRIDVEKVRKRILELETELRTEINKLGTDTTHEVNMAHSYMDSVIMWVKKRVSDLM